MTEPDLPIAEFAFPGPLRDALVSAICAGIKTTTSSLLIEYEIEDEALPQVGSRSIVIDSAGEPVAVIELTDVEVVALGEISVRHAIDEGEGFATVAQWRVEHEQFWRSPEFVAALGGHAPLLNDDTMVVAERFRLVNN